MKILLISNMYPYKDSYFGIYIKRQIETLEDEGIEIIKVVRKKRTFIAYLPFIIKTIIALLFKSYELVHSHYGFHSGLIPSIIKRKPLITTYHGSDAQREPFRNRIYYMLQKFTISRSDRLIAVSNGIKKVITESFNAKSDKISVISCEVDTSEFRPQNKIKVRKELGIDEKKKIVLFAGNICYLKGVDMLYLCAKEMPKVLFFFVGDGDYRSNNENCIFVGSRPHQEMPMWMNAADIFVLPSRSEGTPVVILEALSCGTAVISTNVGGCPDVINDGQTGFLFSVNNGLLLQEKITYLLDNKEKCALMGIQGRKRMVEKYDKRKIGQRIKRLYNDALR